MTVVGIIANPMAGRDVRRLVAHASVFPNAEKANMVQRILSSLAATGVERALIATDLGGISAAVARMLARPTRPRWPDLRFLDRRPPAGTAADTVEAVGEMVEAGARAIVCLGGDGTARAAAMACGEVPLLALSTGTNNVFPEMREATVAGLATGIVATGALPPGPGLRRACCLEVLAGDRRERALVDVCVVRTRHVGSRALWDPAALAELYCTFAEPDAIGLSSIAGLLCPSPRTAAGGVALRLGPPEQARWVVRAPIAPGLPVEVGVRSWRPLAIDETVEVEPAEGVLALDGEREIEYGGIRPRVRLRRDGPLCIDVGLVLARAARAGVLSRPAGDAARRAIGA
jgi:ATP-NAD kinase N-terminal domain